MSPVVIGLIVANVVGLILSAVFGVIARRNWAMNHAPDFTESIFQDEPTDKGLLIGSLAYWGEKQTSDMRAHILAAETVEIADAGIIELDLDAGEIRRNREYAAPLTDVQRATLTFLLQGREAMSTKELSAQNPLET